MKKTFKINNLDLIRLFAALQVAISHTINHLGIEGISPVVSEFLRLFPGVPVFFFISGFLISKSYESSISIKEYSRNRILRIYPALIIVTVFGISSVYLTGYFQNVTVSINQIIIWFLTQTTILQFYNPEFMRGFGTGVLNGSLWTISVELQFYVLIPLLYALFRLFQEKKNTIILFSLILFSMIIHYFYFEYQAQYSEVLLYKLLGVSFFPWFYMFLIGILFQKHFAMTYKLLKGKLLLLVLAYTFMIYMTNWDLGNGINPILYLLLAGIVFSSAYSYPELSNKILKGNDISYGVYIYHILFVNLFLYYGFTSNISSLIMIIGVTVLFAATSWVFIEKPSMRLKRTTIH